jgi:hypothetical protein
MSETLHERLPEKLISGSALMLWRASQIAVWIVGVAIFSALLFMPKVGIHAFWSYPGSVDT